MKIGQLEIELIASVARLEKDMAAAGRIVTNTSNGMVRAANAVKEALASVGAGIGLAQIIQLSDQYAKFTAQLRLATQSTREYDAAYADVRRISTAAQQDLQATGMLYARIANGTRELGTTQKQVAVITETVNMALKVSGATAAESASAQLQLSQAFASGTLRGEEFNAVNEAAPRLMLALADGIGVPVGALKKMAEEGQITSKIMADVLPRALEDLRNEAKETHTIAGAFTVLKNNVMEFVGVQANASGGVAMLTGAIGLLANNLGLLAGSVLTLGAAKLATMISAWTVRTYEQVTASVALRAATIAAAQAGAADAAAKVAQLSATQVMIVIAREEALAKLSGANANIASAQTAMAAAAAAGAQSFALRALKFATAELAVAEAARAAMIAELAILGQQQARVSAQVTAATVAQTAAQGALTAATSAGGVAAGIGARALGLLGGPIGAVVTLLGLGATAWAVWGNKASESEKQVAATLAEETDEYIANLQKQIDKLKERNELAGKGMVSGGLPATDDDKKREAVIAEINRVSKDATLDIAQKTEVMRVWGARLNTIDQDIASRAVEQATAKDSVFTSKYAEWLGKNGTAAQKEAHELAELRKEFGRITPEMEKWVKAKHADKGAAAAIKQEATAYQALMTSIGEKIAAGKLEALGYENMTEAQKMTVKLDAEIAHGKNILSAKSIEAARAAIAVVAAQDSENLSAANVNKATEKLNDERAKAYSSAMAEVEANELLVKTFGKTAAQIEAMELARMEERLSQRASLELDEKEVAQLERMIALKTRNVAAKTQLGVLDTGSDATKAKELLDILVAVDAATKSAADGMAASFGRVGAAIGGLTTALSGYALQQQAITAQLAAAKADPKNGPEKIAKLEIAAAQASAQAKVRSYGDMASAAKGFFKENTTGYKVMEGAEKAFRAAEMAMAIETMLTKSGLTTAFTGLFVASKATEVAAETTKTGVSTALAGTEASAWGITAVVKALASLPFPANLAAGAATLAAVVAIGAKLFGGIGGGGSGGGMSAADAQKAQGTGGVFGDTGAKTESIMKSLEMLESHSDDLLPINRGMLSALRNIEASMSGLTNLLIRTPGIVDGTNMGIAEGSTSNPAIRGFLGKLNDIEPISRFLNNLWGKTKTNIVDSGVQFGGSVNDLQSGLGYSQYASVDTTKSSWFGLKKKTSNSVETQALSAELSTQFGLIFTNLEGALTSAAVGMGMGAAQVANVLDKLVIDTTSISLKGLAGQDLTDALNGVISKTMDEMAVAVFPEMDKFRQVGEGYAETVIRIASNYATLDATLGSIGMTFGPVGLGSLAAREHLIMLSGGIDKFSEHAAGFAENFLTEAQRLAPVQKYVTESLAALGYMGDTALRTRDDFAAAVLGLQNGGALATESGAATFAALMSLQGAFASVTPEIKDMSKSLADIASERKSLQDQLDEMTMSTAELATKARNAIDPLNQSLYDQVRAATAAKEATERLTNERKGLQDQFDQLTMSPAQLAAKAREAIDPLNRGLYDQVQLTKDAIAANDALAVAQKKAADDLKLAVTSTMEAVNKSVSAEKARIGVIRDVASESVRSVTGVFDLLKDQVSELYGTVGSTSAMQATQGNAFIDAALSALQTSGYLPDQRQLASAIAAARNGLGATEFATQFEADRAALVMAGKLSQIQGMAGYQLTAAEQSLKIANDQLSALDAQLEYAKRQVDELNGIKTGVLSVGAAMSGLMSAVLAAKSPASSMVAPVIGSGMTDSVGGGTTGYASNPSQLSPAQLAYYDSLKATTPNFDASSQLAYVAQLQDSQALASLEAAKGIFNPNESADDMMRRYGYKVDGISDDPKTRYSYAVGTNYVPSDGPAYLHEGEAVVPRAYNPAAGGVGGGNTERLERLVEALTTEVQRLSVKADTGNDLSSRISAAVNGNPDRPIPIDVAENTAGLPK